MAHALTPLAPGDADATLGPQNPKPLQGQDVPLYECGGRVHGVVEFARSHLGLLSDHEAGVVVRHIESLNDAKSIPSDLRPCLCRSSDFRSTASPPLHARRSGARSAYDESRGLKFKGCRPVVDGAEFPMEVLPFGSGAIEYTKVPFGVMRAEGVMREILAFCFATQHVLPIHSIPVCVWAYGDADIPLGYCLVLDTMGETRVEQFIDYPSHTVGDVIRAARDGRTSLPGVPIGSELALRGVNLWDYVGQKAGQLVRLHFSGGSRGLLNSNIGNDVLVRGAGGEVRVFLCDFDTFCVTPVPEVPDSIFLSAFVLRCLVEIVKGSLSILEYVDLPGDLSTAHKGERLAEVYFGRSSCWRAYKREFDRQVAKRNWDPRAVAAAFERACKSEAFVSVAAMSVLSSCYVDTMAAERGVFYPHN